MPVVEALLDYLGTREPENTHGYVVAPTGSGKTVIIATMLEELRLRGELPRTFISVPTKHLVDQTYNELVARGFRGDIRMLKTGNVRDEGQGDVVIATQAAFTRHTTNKPDYALYAIKPELYGLLIFDEAHHLQGYSTQLSLEQHFRHARKLGVTATDDYDANRLLSDILPDKIFEITTEEGVEQGLIAPYVTGLLVTPADMSKVRVTGKEFDQYLLQQALNTQVRNYAIAKFTAENLADKKLMFNVNRVDHAEALSEALRFFGVPGVAVHGGMKEAEFKSILKRYREGSIKALAQARVLGEGFDDPSIEVVINVTPTLSWVREKQRTGRGQRIDPNNPNKTLLVIECIDHNYQRSPVLYGHPEVTGHWQVAPSGINPSFQQFVNGLESYDNGTVHFTADPNTIDDWRLDTRVTQTLFNEHSEPVELHNGDVVPIKLGDLVPAIFESGGRPKKPSLQTPQVKEKQRKVQDASKRLRERRLEKEDDDYEVELDEDEEPVSAYAVIEGLSSASRAFAMYILDGGAVPRLQPYQARIALHTLAGKVELQDPSVRDRFHEVNGMLLDDRVDGAAFDDAEEKRVTENMVQFLKKVVKPGILDNSDANCKGLGSERFFTERGQSTRPAKEVCIGCKMEGACLEHAIKTTERFGVWGRKSERERRRERRRLLVARRVTRTEVVPEKVDKAPEPIEESIEEDVYTPDASDLAEAQAMFGPVAVPPR